MTEKPPLPNTINTPVSPPRPVRLTRGKSDSSSRTATTQSLPLKPAAVVPVSTNNNGTAQPIYGNTSYDRRLAKRRRIDEKKLSWQDLRQFSQFVDRKSTRLNSS